MLRRTKPESRRVTDSSPIRSRLVPSLNAVPVYGTVQRHFFLSLPRPSPYVWLILPDMFSDGMRSERRPKVDCETQSQKGHVPIR